MLSSKLLGNADVNISNGRVDILGPIGPQFGFSDQIPIRECTSYNSALRGTWTETKLSLVFFSEQNIELLQNQIRVGVFNMSKQQFVIGKQSCDELKIIMRSIYLQNSKNLPINITEQVKKLNNLVVEYSVNQIYNEAIGYLKYKRDSSTMHVIPDHPTNSSGRGNTLELQPFF
tara:strand:+ start:81 stop:602 length:522 start_codon:yes stop_codon:yes gene_type:complete